MKTKSRERQIIRVGFIGTGWWATQNHLPILVRRKDVRLAGVCSLGKRELLRVQKQFGFSFATEDVDELLSVIDMDCVFVASPNHLHYEHCRAALEGGVHVACEKPMALNFRDASHLAELARDRNLHFLIPYGWNYNELVVMAREQIRTGLIGPIEYLSGQLSGPTFELFEGRQPFFAKDAAVPPDVATWSDATRGGGYGHGQLTHLLALLFWTTGLSPKSVHAFMGLLPTGVDLHNAVAMEFENGAVGVASGCGRVPRHLGYQLELKVFGREGMLVLDLEDGRERFEIRRHDGKDILRSVKKGEGAYSCVEPVHRFLDLVQGRPVRNHSPAELGARVVGATEAAYRSRSTGRPQPVGLREEGS